MYVYRLQINWEIKKKNVQAVPVFQNDLGSKTVWLKAQAGHRDTTVSISLRDMTPYCLLEVSPHFREVSKRSLWACQAMSSAFFFLTSYAFCLIRLRTWEPWGLRTFLRDTTKLHGRGTLYVKLVEALCYNLGGRAFQSLRGYWIIFQCT
jgi:hypothetical protein